MAIVRMLIEIVYQESHRMGITVWHESHSSLRLKPGAFREDVGDVVYTIP
jgi:hypothetical protein